LFLLVQKSVAPINSFAKSLLPFGEVEGATGEQLQAAMQTIADSKRREQLGSRSSEFNGQWEAIEARTDFLNGSFVFRGNGKIGPYRCGALGKQLDGKILSERSYGEFLFAIDMEKGAAGNQDFEGGASFQDIRKDGSRRQNLFEVVQQKQEGPGVLQVVADKLRDGPVWDGLDSESVSQRGSHQIGMPDRREADKLNAGGELMCNGGGYGKSQTCFPGATGAGERQEANVGAEEQGGCFGKLLLASNEGSTGNGKIVAPGGDLLGGLGRKVASIGQIEEFG